MGGKRHLSWAGRPETDAEQRLRELRQSGYNGWIDQDGHAVACSFCGDPACRLGITGHSGQRTGGGR
jgi:hypothetical protein